MIKVTSSSNQVTPMFNQNKPKCDAPNPIRAMHQIAPILVEETELSKKSNVSWGSSGILY